MKKNICLAVFFAGLIALFGTAGAIETGSISSYMLIVRVIVILGIMLAAIKIGKLYKDE